MPNLAEVVSAAAGGRSQLCVLVGEASTGRTRACWEAIRAPIARLRLRDGDHYSAESAAREAADRGPAVWRLRGFEPLWALRRPDGIEPDGAPSGPWREG
ncbi:hypothetical protein [Streptomyces catenulae]|uniref:Uncharacterized protein n=1 Tax=Streptomyces catenulae TaxID=66875 RepID=A0ABV2YSN5_9ACTN|nr:hypothetical protein [Streptomyces catenulae]